MHRRTKREVNVAYMFAQPFYGMIPLDRGTVSSRAPDRLQVEAEISEVVSAARDAVVDWRNSVSIPNGSNHRFVRIVVRPGTKHGIIEVLEQGVDVLHLCCHGLEHGVVLEGKDNASGEAYFLDIDSLIDAMGSSGANPPHVAFLGSCHGMELACRLCEAGIPFIIASTREVPDSLFRKLTRTFYRALFRQESEEIDVPSVFASVLAAVGDGIEGYVKLVHWDSQDVQDRLSAGYEASAGAGIERSATAAANPDPDSDTLSARARAGARARARALCAMRSLRLRQGTPRVDVRSTLDSAPWFLPVPA